jgi:hypothetical protein
MLGRRESHNVAIRSPICRCPSSLLVAAALAAVIAVEVQAQTILASGVPEFAAQPTGAVSSADGREGVESRASRTKLGFCDTVAESIFGKPDPSSWRPLPLSTFFSEGWDEPWVPSPRGSGGAPRQGWINSAAGYLARTQFLTFAQGFNESPKSDGYLGSYTLLTPLNRRLLIVTSIPFVLHNNVDSGLPINDPSLRPRAATAQNQTGFGDITITPRALLKETKDFSLTAEVAVVTPTGTQPLAGATTTLIPAVSFWNNIAGSVVIRGSIGVAFPTDGSGDESIGQLAVGQTVTDHDVPFFGDFTYYLATVVNTPLTNADQTRVTLTPGIRTHLGSDWYFLAGLPTPVTKQRVADLGLICWLMKSW